MNIVNNLGSYETLEQVWKSYPEGGKDGDYLYIGDELRYWNKYSYSWVASDIPESSLIKPIEVTYAEGVIDYSEGYINYIGSFDGFEQVWDMYPNGGKDGDYILVAGERYKWNKHISNWGEIDLSDVTPARPIATVYGDLHVHNDAVIGENLYARILETFTTKKWVLEQGYISLNDITSDVVMARILTDNETITKRNGRLVVIGGTGSGGGTADSVAWENITGKPYWIGDEKPQYTLAEITGSDGDGFVTIKGDQAIEGVKDFAYGAKFGGALLRYDTSKKCWIFPNNVLVEGGIAWNSSIDGFDPHTITDAVEVDWKTIGKDENGALYVIGGAGGDSGSVEGGVAMSDVQQYVTSVLTNYAKKGATLSAYGITDAYTKNEADAKFVDFTTDNQQITGLKNFVNGLRIGGLPITAPLDDVVYIDANVVIRGGVAWNSSIEGFKPQTILDALTVDEITISKKNGYLEFIGTIDGGVADNVAWDGITGKPTDIAGYGITDAYTKVQIDDALAKKWTRNDQSISNWSAAYSWGNHASAGYAKQSDITSEFSKYVTLSTAQTITGIKNFANGLKVGSVLVSYNADKNAFVLPANLLVEGGVAWNSKIDGFDVPTIMDAIQVDGDTISKEDGYLKFVGKAGGGVADSVAWENVTGRPTKLSQFTNDSGFITSSSLPTKLSQLTDDVVTGNYLPINATAANSSKLLGVGLANGNGRNGIPTLSEAGYMEAGIAMDFHRYDDGVDFSTRLRVANGNFGNIVWLPTADGTIALTSDITNALASYVTIGTAQNITGVKDFVNGFKIGGTHVTYNASKNAFVFPANAIFEGGVAWNASIDGFTPKTIMDAIIVDDSTISKANGYLEFIGKAGGLDETELANYLTTNNYAKKSDIPSLSGYATQAWVTGRGYITGITPSMVTTALGYTPYNAANFTKANIKSTLGISDWALASAKPTYTASEVGALGVDDTAQAAKRIVPDNSSINATTWNGVAGLSVGGWNSNGAGFSNTYGTTINFQGISTWYHRLAFATDGVIEHWMGINTTTMSKVGRIAYMGSIPTNLSQFTDDVVKGNYLAQDSSSTNADLDTILENKTAVLKPFFQSFTSNNIGSARKGILRMTYNGSESQLLFDHYNRLLQYRTIGSNPKDWATIAFTSDIPTKLSQLTDDVVKGNYLSTSGGTVNGNITATGNVSAQSVIANGGITAGSVLSFVDTDASKKIVLQRNSSGDILFCGDFADRNVYIDGSILRVRTENTIFSRGISTTGVTLRSGDKSAVISYNASKNAFVFPANAIFEGGVAWNSPMDGTSAYASELERRIEALQTEVDTLKQTVQTLTA